MSSGIQTFGSSGAVVFRVEGNGPPQAVSMCRELWFDRDINGQWLVCAARQQGIGADVGSIVVTDPRVGDFIAMLAELVAHPDQFTDEPRFHSPH